MSLESSSSGEDASEPTLDIRSILQEDILVYIGASGSPPYSLEISKKTGSLPGSVTPALQGMVEKGLLSRSKEETIRKGPGRPPGYHYSLTEKGSELLAPYLEAKIERLATCLAALRGTEESNQ